MQVERKRPVHETETQDNRNSNESSSSSSAFPSSTDHNEKPEATTTTTTSRKRPRTGLSVPSDVDGERSNLISLIESDDPSVDTPLDAVDTILHDEKKDSDSDSDYQRHEIDPDGAMKQRLPLPDAVNDDPDDYLLMLLHAMFPHQTVKVQVKSSVDLKAYFPVPTEEQMSNYTTEIVNIIRMNTAADLQQYYQQKGRAALDCCNRFGEGLLNMACRRGFTQSIRYLLSPDIQLNVRVRDDGGRTPLHDACWYPEPQIEVCTWIIQQDPSLFLVADNRGYTPFQYARKNDWPIWRQFLYDNYMALHALGTKPEIMETFSIRTEEGTTE